MNWMFWMEPGAIQEQTRVTKRGCHEWFDEEGKIVGAERDYSRERRRRRRRRRRKEGGGGGGGGVMHSSVNEIHHHPSDSFVTFSTGATGRPQDHIPRTRTSLWRLRGTLFSHFWNVWETFQHVLHTHTQTQKHTHLQLPRWSKDRHYASHLLSYIKRRNSENES